MCPSRNQDELGPQLLARWQWFVVGRDLHPRRGLRHRPALSLPSGFPRSGDAGG
jgi:hypothetical protein